MALGPAPALEAPVKVVPAVVAPAAQVSQVERGPLSSEDGN